MPDVKYLKFFFDTILQTIEPFVPQWCFLSLALLVPISLLMLWLFRANTKVKIAIILFDLVLAFISIIAHLNNTRMITIKAANAGHVITDGKIEIKETGEYHNTNNEGTASFKLHKKYSSFTVSFAKAGYRPFIKNYKSGENESTLVELPIEASFDVLFNEPKDHIDIRSTDAIPIKAQILSEDYQYTNIESKDVKLYNDDVNMINPKSVSNGKIIADFKYKKYDSNLTDHYISLKLFNKYTFKKYYVLYDTINLGNNKCYVCEPSGLKKCLKTPQNSINMVLGGQIREGTVWLPINITYDKPITISLIAQINNTDTTLTINFGGSIRILIGEDNLKKLRLEYNDNLVSSPKWKDIINTTLERQIMKNSLVRVKIVFIPVVDADSRALGTMKIDIIYHTENNHDFNYTHTDNIPLIDNINISSKIGIGGINNTIMGNRSLSIYNIKYAYASY